jgi:hypothetical protein
MPACSISVTAVMSPNIEEHVLAICMSHCHVSWAPVTTAWHVLGLWMEGRPATVEGSCEYIEQAAAYKQQGVVLQLGGGGGLGCKK